MVTVAGGLLAIGVLAAPPGLADALRLALLLGVAATVAGAAALRRREAPALPWWLLAAAVVAFAGASAIRLSGLDAAPSVDLVAHLCVLAGYLLVAAAALVLTRGVAAGGQREGLLDGAIVAAALMALLTLVLFDPELATAEGPSPVHLLIGPVVFAAVAGIISRFALLMPRRCASAQLLVATTVGALAGNLLRTAQAAVGQGYTIGSLADALLLGGYVTLGVAAAHPSARRLTAPGAAERGRPRPRLRLLLLGGALLVPPVMLALVPSSAGRWFAALAAGLLNLLVLWRLASLLAEGERVSEALRAQSRRDPLTGLGNRLHVDEALEGALARAARHGGGVGLVFCDVDAFKAINDAHGHRVGDRVLVELAGRMEDVVRAGETIGRLAGDEFVVVVEGADAAGLTSAAERVRRAVDAPVRVDGIEVHPTVSLGTELAEGACTPAELFDSADRAMYRAKRAHRGPAAAAHE